MRLLLHACCAPCSLEPVRLLQEEGHDITLAYINPNIHPREEYDHRLDTITQWAATAGLDIIEGGYDPDEWERVAGQYGTDRPRRCRACYRIRFEAVAAIAVREGFDGIGTTLTVSPYQFTEVIGEELRRAAKPHGLAVVFQDYRENYPEATRRSRELGMYRQNFCGCHYSYVEAQNEREERREMRRAAKEAKRAAREAAEAATAALDQQAGSAHADK